MDIMEIIDYLTKNTHDPVPAYIIQKELLKEPEESPRYVSAYTKMQESKWYQDLAGEQREDGSWGRFHSMDSQVKDKRRFATTEAALSRAYELGLTRDDPIVAKCLKLMVQYINGEKTWTDNIEKHHDGGKSHLHARNFLTAARINQFDPENPIIKPFKDIFAETLRLSFADGYFDEKVWENENRHYRGPCLNGWNVYP